MEMETRIFFSPQITQISADGNNKIITPCKSALIRVSKKIIICVICGEKNYLRIFHCGCITFSFL